jgi:hypothetical protein
MERVSRMTIEERVKAALSMGQRFSRVKELAKEDRAMVDADATLRADEEVVGVLQSHGRSHRSHRCGGFGRLPLCALNRGFGSVD